MINEIDTDPTRDREAELAAYARKQHEKDVVELMRQPAFRRWLMTTLERCNVFGYSFAVDGNLARHEGRRSVGADLLAEVSVLAPDDWARAFTESVARAKQTRMLIESARDAAPSGDES